MKEASGELSMTAVAVVAIGAVALIFTTLVYPNLKKTLAHNSACSGAYACQPDSSNPNQQKCLVVKPEGECSTIGATASGTSECEIICNRTSVN